jgi:hypothetical protein
MNALADDFMLSATGMKGNSENFADAWANASIPEEEVFAKNFAKAIMIKSRSIFKMSRYGLLGKLIFVTLLTYNDEGTDLRMLINYRQGGEATERYFWISLGILIVPTVLTMAMNWIQDKKKGTASRIKGQVLSLLQLQPIMHAYAVWSGEEQAENESLSPFLMFVGQRTMEVSFEAVPEVSKTRAHSYRIMLLGLAQGTAID